MVRWLLVGRALVITGAILIILLAAVALAGVEPPTSYVWATFAIAAFLLMLAGQLIILIAYADRRRQKVQTYPAQKIVSFLNLY